LKYYSNYSKEERDFCLNVIREFNTDCHSKSKLFGALVVLCSHIHHYCKLVLNTDDCYDYITTEVGVVNKISNIVPRRYHEIVSVDEVKWANTQCHTLYNYLRNSGIGCSDNLQSDCDKFVSFRNDMVHDIKEYGTYLDKRGKSLMRALPSMEFVGKVTELVLDSDIGYEFIARVAEHFSGVEPKKFTKWKEEQKKNQSDDDDLSIKVEYIKI